MKSFNFSHWKLEETGPGLLFFCQTLEEMLFHYGHDSLKVPALNFHFLCVEIRNTIMKINNDVVDKGNMRPLLEELKDAFVHDTIAQRLFGDDFDSLFFIKNAGGEIQRNCSEIFKDPSCEASIKRIERVINYLLSEMNRDRQYYSLLQAAITDTIKTYPFEIDEQSRLYQLSRMLLTELINQSYSQEYIYWVVNDVFYNYHRLVETVDESLSLFWSSFDFEEKEYVVVLPLKTSLSKHLSNFENVTVKSNEQGMFDSSCKQIVELTIEARDPYRAQSHALALVSFFASLLQYNNHKSRSFTADKAIVTLKGTEKVYRLQSPITPLRRGNTLSEAENTQKIEMMVNNFSFSPMKLINVIDLHSSALNSSDIGNQLLNLWTIIEVLVPTEPKHSYSKINQICNAVTSVLNAQYSLSLVKQLLADLHRCVPDTIEEQLIGITKGANDIEKLAAILVLPEFQGAQTVIISSLASYPLLQYRITYYSKILSDRAELKSFLIAHRKRLSWQIMRIYRNRNMIVHDGSHFPYADIIVQNLHYYVDTIIDTINLYAGNGYKSINTIFTAIQQKEYRYQLLLEQKDAGGKWEKVGSDFVSVVFGYLT